MTEVSIEFTSPDGEMLRFDWSLEALRSLDPGRADPPVWTLAGEIDWDLLEAVRVVSGRFDDGRLIAVAALRPAGAEGHGDEAITGVIVDAEDVSEQLAEVLLSTERGRDGALLRIGLEVSAPEAGLPTRIAGDVSGRSVHRDGGLAHEHAGLALRAGSVPGAGAYEHLKPA